MIIDERTYTIRPTYVEDFLKMYDELGRPTHQRILGNLIGYFTVEVGEVNQVVHMWGYESMADRERRRAILAADPVWQDYYQKAKAKGYIVHQQTRILSSTWFSPL